MKLSIIIPIYNVERYVERAIVSCLDQDLEPSDYEIICVDDGTPDGSMAIVERLASQNDNIRIISQENQGLSAARNTGLAAAEGDYVWFVDSDDWIRSHSLRQIVERLEGDRLDALRLMAADSDAENTRSRERFSVGESEVMRGSEIVHRLGVEMCAQFTIYRRAVLLDNGLEFARGIYHEDNEFTPRAYYYLERIAVLDQITYYLYQRPDSITHSVNTKRSYDLLLVAGRLRDFSHGVSPSYRRYLHKCIAVTLNLAMLCAMRYDTQQRREFSQSLVRQRDLFASFWLSRHFTFMVEGVLLQLSPRHALAIYARLDALRRS